MIRLIAIRFLILVHLLNIGCSIVSIHGDADVQVTKYPGLVSVSIEPRSQAVYVRTSSVGAAKSSSHFSLGWLQEETVAFSDPNACRLVIVTKSIELLYEVEGYLKGSGVDLNTICLVGKE
jgi:hypothetical protein